MGSKFERVRSWIFLPGVDCEYVSHLTWTSDIRRVSVRARSEQRRVYESTYSLRVSMEG